MHISVPVAQKYHRGSRTAILSQALHHVKKANTSSSVQHVLQLSLSVCLARSLQPLFRVIANGYRYIAQICYPMSATHFDIRPLSLSWFSAAIYNVMPRHAIVCRSFDSN